MGVRSLKSSMSTEDIALRVNKLRLKAAQRFNVSPEKCHVGHAVLEAMLENLDAIHQIDGFTGKSETNRSVASRSVRFASAMKNLGLKPGDPVVISAPNHLDVAVPFFASHYNGYSICCVEPLNTETDLKHIFTLLSPKFIICQKDCFEKNKNALEATDTSAFIVTFDDKDNDMETFIAKYNGLEIGYRPAEFNTATTASWLMLSSGTTGLPKLIAMSYDNLLNGIQEWWHRVPEPVTMKMTMLSTQWLTGLVFFISAPLKSYIRLQSSRAFDAQLMIKLIMQYRPTATAWTPFLLGMFLQVDSRLCDLSCFEHILIGGAPVDKNVLDGFRKICKARLYINYGMSELFVPVFVYNQDTPFGSAGRPFLKYQYRLVEDDGTIIQEPHKKGELWIKGDAFFMGYYNNPEETSKVMTEDGWFKTGDIFYKDEQHDYYYVERKSLRVRFKTFWLSCLQFESIIKKHPGVQECVLVAIANSTTMELPVAAILKKKDAKVDPQEIFQLFHAPEYSEVIKLHGGLFFVDAFPVTSSGKINRSKVKELATTVERIMPN